LQATEVYSFQLLNALYACNSLDTLRPFLPTVFNLLLHRMQVAVKESKTSRYCRLFLHSMCVFSAVHGGQPLGDILEAITAGLTSMIIQNIWSFNREKCAGSDALEVKHIVVGAARLLVESQAVCGNPEVWGSLLKSVWACVDENSSSSGGAAAAALAADWANDAEEGGAGGGLGDFDSAYSKLAYATIPEIDPCADCTQAPAQYFAQTLAAFFKQPQGAQFYALLPKYLDANEAAAAQRLLAQFA
jgi:hypothetical protein